MCACCSNMQCSFMSDLSETSGGNLTCLRAELLNLIIPPGIVLPVQQVGVDCGIFLP